MALKDVKVIEMGGLAPGPFCGQILADFGANVIRIDRFPDTHYGGPVFWNRKKRSIALNLKQEEGIEILKELLKKSDVFIDTWRPGVAERLGLGPDVVLQLNPRLIYARLTGWGQSGPIATTAGHDINYIALSGALHMIARKGEKPLPPLNLLGDFAAGGLLCAFGILLALFERERSGKGQVIDSAMLDGTAYLSTFIYKHFAANLWNLEAGTNMLDSASPFYNVYRTKDNRHVAVGAIEPQFFSILVKGLGLEGQVANRFDPNEWPRMQKQFQDVFQTKTMEEWTNIFGTTDACVTPILDMTEVSKHPHNSAREIISPHDSLPAPAPRLSRTPAISLPSDSTDFESGFHSPLILAEFGFSPQQIINFSQKGLIPGLKSKL